MLHRTLVWQELRGLARGRFSLVGVVLLLGFAAIIAATAGASGFSDGFYWPAFGLAPLLLIPVGAWHVASARSTRFVQAVFTTPISQAQYILAQLSAMILLGLLYIACLLPFLAVEAVHVGVSGLMMRYLMLGLGSVLYCAALGVMVGVAFTSRGSMAVLGAAVFAMVACGAGIIFIDVVVGLEESPSRELLLRLLHLTVGVVLSDALGLGNNITDDRASPALAFGLMFVGVMGAALWIFARRQSPEGWHLRRGQALQVAAVFAIVLLVPAAFATPEYEPNPASYQGFQTSSSGVRLQVVEPGAGPDDRLFYERDRILADQANRVDLLVFLFPYDERPQPFRSIEIRMEGTNLSLEPSSHTVQDPGNLPQARPHRNSEPWLQLRIPTIIRTAAPQFLGDNPHLLSINVTYEDANGTRWYAESENLLMSDVEHAKLQMAAVGSVAPLWALTAVVWRRVRTR